ncbi:cytochrome P450 [Lenzites betulinus]|nr:cytochrome P450 [Lenzites betulinus]
MAFLDNLTLSQATLVAVGLYVAWRLVRPLVIKSTIKNIAGPPSPSFLTGNVNQFMGRHSWDWRHELKTKYGRTSTIRGLFNEQWIVTHDPKALQQIFSKDQESFEEPNLSLRIMLGPGLLGTIGEQHRRQRKMLNPVFSTKHLRNLTPLFYEIIHKTRDAMMARLPAGAETGSATDVELDMLSWMGRTTLEVLGQGVLGYSFDPLVEDAPDEFAKTVKAFFPQMQKSAVPRVLLPYFVHIGSAAFRRRVMEHLPNANIRRMKEISDSMHARSVLIFNEKKAALARGDDAVKHQVGEGRDVMSILLKNNMLASAEDKLPDDELLGQVSTMILAGMDTTANTLARILQLLSEHPDVQERLRAEIIAAVEAEGINDTLTYERLMALPYMDAVCRETLRRYPGVFMVFREATRDTVLPLATPVRGLDGELITAVPLPKNTRVIIDTESCNLDPALWGPDASEWKPERWLAGSVPKEVEEARIPGVFSHMRVVMTFLAGSRACIGFNFAQVEIKTVLLIMLQYFRFEPTGASIVWNAASVVYPTVGRESGIPALPLKVSRLRP